MLKEKITTLYLNESNHLFARTLELTFDQRANKIAVQNLSPQVYIPFEDMHCTYRRLKFPLAEMRISGSAGSTMLFNWF